MRRTSPYADRKPLEIVMTPMIDVVFLLLVFFLWTASFQIVEYALPSAVATPQAAGEATVPQEVEDFDQVVVRVLFQAGQTIYQVNQQRHVEPAALRQTLATLASIKNDVPLIIDPDAEVAMNEVIFVYDTARVLNFQRIQFAVEPE